MRFEIAVHAQRGRMRSDLSQQPTLDEKPQIVVDRGERNGWNATSDRGVNAFWGMVSVGSDDGLIDHLTLVRDRQTVLRSQLTELFMGEAHDYRMRIIIKQPRAVSTETFPLTSKTAVGRKTRLWLSYRDRHQGPFLGGWSLALIGNASGQSFGLEQNLDPRRFDETSCASSAPPSMKIGSAVARSGGRECASPIGRPRRAPRTPGVVGNLSPILSVR